MNQKLQTISILFDNILSENFQLIQESENQLTHLSQQNGFSFLLTEFISNNQIPSPKRLLASILLKNSLNKFIRKNSLFTISNEEKENITNRLLEMFTDEDFRIATQVSISIAKIARNDSSMNWKQLFNNLFVNTNKNSDILSLSLLRKSMTIRFVIEELSTKVLPRDRFKFRQIANDNFNNLIKIIGNGIDWLFLFFGNIENEQLSLQQIQQILLTNFENFSHLDSLFKYLLKSCLILSKYGFQPTDNHQILSQFTEQAIKYLEQLFQYRTSLEYLEQKIVSQKNGNDFGNDFENENPLFRLKKLCENIISKTCKLIFQIQEKFTSLFANYGVKTLQQSLDEFYSFLSSNSFRKNANYSKFIAYTLEFLSSILQSVEHNSCFSSQENSTSNIDLIFTQQTISMICEVLVKKVIVMSTQDLDEWKENPENFIENNHIENIEFKLNSATKSFFKSFFKSRTELSTSITFSLLNSITDNNTQILEYDENNILFKDAVYHLIGWGSFQFQNLINFPNFYQNILKNDLISDNSGILIRRIFWLVEQFATQIDKSIIHDIYELITKTLSSPDIVIQISGVDSLIGLIPHLHLNENQGDFVSWIHFLIDFPKNIYSEELAEKILNSLGLLIYYIGDEIKNYAEEIIKFLSQGWGNLLGSSSSNEQNTSNFPVDFEYDSPMLKNIRKHILVVLSAIVNSLGMDSIMFYSLILPIIQNSVDSNCFEFSVLTATFECWLSIIRNSITISDFQNTNNTEQFQKDYSQLFEIFPSIFKLLTVDEDLKKGLEIIEAYIIIGEEHFLNSFVNQIMEEFSVLIPQVSNEAILQIYQVLDLILIRFPQDIAMILEKSGLLQILFESIISFKFEDELNTTGPLLNSKYILLISRVIIHEPMFFLEFLNKFAQNQNGNFGNFQDVLFYFFDKWIELNDYLLTFQNRKLSHFALSVLFSFEKNYLLLKIEILMTLFIGLFHEKQDLEDPNSPLNQQKIKGIENEKNNQSLIHHEFNEDDSKQIWEKSIEFGIPDTFKNYLEKFHLQFDSIINNEIVLQIKQNIINLVDSLNEETQKELLNQINPNILNQFQNLFDLSQKK
ncbi:importin-11 [Anaeramoeba ignava]|uniref:Importin-11 n=1 Tax=Anaeramoeba ignava TaxID=1746090 RepID=A0A9Q0R455_ANAIG|nr:importin-11 [Anaeramoeba ignava]